MSRYICSSDTFEIINQNIILVQYSMVDLIKEAHIYEIGLKWCCLERQFQIKTYPCSAIIMLFFLNFFHEYICSSDTVEIINQNIIVVQYSNE